MAVSTKGGVLSAKQNQVTKATASTIMQQMLSSASVQARFSKMLGEETESFMSSVLTVFNDNDLLQKADPRTILAAAATAASLHLPVLPTLGKAYIVPYGGSASFQLGYKGCIELAMRTGQMKSIVAVPVYEGEITKWDKFTEEIERGEKVSDKVIGYYAAFELLNGFRKATYWTVKEVENHALTYSQQSKNAGKLAGVWKTQFDAMARKTVLMSILKTFSPMSVKMQQAMAADGEVSVMNESGDIETFEFTDVDAVPVNDAENDLAKE